MKLTVISLIFLISTVSALDFQLSSPSSANLDEQFKVSLNADTSETYDVKLFVQNQNKEILSEIYGDGWKNSFYYLKSVFPQTSEFQVKITKFSENSELCARLRKSGKTSFDEKCAQISINNKEIEETSAPKEVESKQETSSKPDIKETEKEDSSINKRESENIKVDMPEEEILNVPYQTISQKERIVLGANKETKEPIPNQVFKTKQSLLRNSITYSFIGLCIILIILLALNRL